jgi:hypothetical protein
MVWEFFATRGWIDFDRATPTITDFFSSGRTQLAADEPAALAVADLMHLNAAEADLPVAATQDRLQTDLAGQPFHLVVSADAARFAINATDSGPFVGHDPRQSRRFWDVTLFSSDASKLAWLADTDSLETLRERFVPAVSDLAGLYRAGEGDFGYESFEVIRRAMPVQATLWRAKLAVLLAEDEDERLVASLADVYFTLSRSA